MVYTAPMPPLLEAKHLTKHYGATIALESVSFQVREGITGLLGANGAGKTTVIKLFLGLLKPTAGSVQVLGREAYGSVEVRARLGYMPEHDCLPGSMTASDFLNHMAQISGLPPAYARTRAADVFRHVGLEEERYRAMGEYSSGMKQRVKLAQALVHDPFLVLLDEPTAGLDPGGRQEMLDLIRRTSKDFGVSVMLSSHLMADIERTCDRIIVLDGGHLEREGTVSGFTQETQTLFIEVDDHRHELMVALANRGIDASVDGPSLLVELENDDQYDAIRDAIVESNASLRKLAPGRHRLTDIFQSPQE